MSIDVTCDECFHEFSVPDKYAGRRGKCPACGAAVTVADEAVRDEPRPARRSGPAKKGKPRRKRSTSNSGVVLLVGGGVVAVGLIVFAAMGFFSSDDRAPGNIAGDAVEADENGSKESPFSALATAIVGEETDEQREARRVAEINKAYDDLAAAKQRQANLTQHMVDVQSVQRHLSTLSGHMKDEYNLILKIGELGGELPPMGMPRELYQKYSDAARSIGAFEEQLAAQAPDAWQELMKFERHGDPAQIAEAFRVHAKIRAQGKDRILAVKLVKRDITGPRHQKMSQMLYDQIGAKYSEVKIDGDEYRVLYAPVKDVAKAAESITIGTVSELDVGNRSFTLTIDPLKVPEPTAEEYVTDPFATLAYDVGRPVVTGTPPSASNAPGVPPGFPGAPSAPVSGTPPAAASTGKSNFVQVSCRPEDLEINKLLTFTQEIEGYVPQSLAIHKEMVYFSFQTTAVVDRDRIEVAAKKHGIAATDIQSRPLGQ